MQAGRAPAVSSGAVGDLQSKRGEGGGGVACSLASLNAKTYEPVLLDAIELTLFASAGSSSPKSLFIELPLLLPLCRVDVRRRPRASLGSSRLLASLFGLPGALEPSFLSDLLRRRDSALGISLRASMVAEQCNWWLYFGTDWGSGRGRRRLLPFQTSQPCYGAPAGRLGAGAWALEIERWSRR